MHRGSHTRTIIASRTAVAAAEGVVRLIATVLGSTGVSVSPMVWLPEGSGQRVPTPHVIEQTSIERGGEAGEGARAPWGCCTHTSTTHS